MVFPNSKKVEQSKHENNENSTEYERRAVGYVVEEDNADRKDGYGNAKQKECAASARQKVNDALLSGIAATGRRCLHWCLNGCLCRG